MSSSIIPEGNYKPRGRVYVAELAAILDRTQHTIRCWQRDKMLPRGAYPRRDERGWRYWTPEQVDIIVAWLETRRPQSEEKLLKLRAQRKFEGGGVV
jgi:hypothetical protein